MLRKLVIIFAVVVIFIGGAFTAYQVSNESQNDAARNIQSVDGEQITQQVGLWQLTDNATKDYVIRANETVTVYNESGVELTKGEDYQWNASDMSIRFLDTASTTDGANATIDYYYIKNTQEVQEVGGPIHTVTEAIGQQAMLAAGLGLVILLLVFGAYFGKKFLSADSVSTNR